MILKISKMKRKLSHFNNSTFLVKVERIKKEISLLFFFLFPDDTMELIRKRAINFENLNKTERIKKAS